MQRIATHAADVPTHVVRDQVGSALLLAWVAAFGDAIGYLTLRQLGASYMSGNSMSSGVALGQAEWVALLNHGLPILSFVLGLLLGILVLLQMRHWGVRSGFAAIFVLEIVCMLAFIWVGSRALQQGVIPQSQPGVFYTCMILLTMAMGLQTATIRKIGTQGVRTTFITGVLSSLTEAFVQYVSWLHVQATERRFRQALGQSMQQPVFRNMLLLSGVWGCYVLGAICGSLLEARLSLSALLFPIGMLVLLIIADIVRPFDQ